MTVLSQELLYVRAGLGGTGIKTYEMLADHLRGEFGAEEIFSPNFFPIRRKLKPKQRVDRSTHTMNKLAALLKSQGNAFETDHPHYRFVGVGERLSALAGTHKSDLPFAYLDHILAEQDFSMLLWGCVESSPGFSTIHVAQERLGLTRKHLLRLLFRWDYEDSTITAPTLPGCSAGFGRMYDSYRRDNNLIKGAFLGKSYILIPSARAAVQQDFDTIRNEPHAVSCERLGCIDCKTKFYR